MFTGAPHRIQNKFAALALFLEGNVNLHMFGTTLLLDIPGDHAGALLASFAAWFLLLPAYLALVSTLGSPLARPFATRTGRVLLAASGLAILIIVFLASERFLAAVVRATHAPWDIVPGPWYYAAAQVSVFVFLYGLLVAIHAWRRAPKGSIKRQQAGGFAVAFGIRDVGLSIVFLAIVLDRTPRYTLHDSVLPDLTTPVVILAFATVLAYAILKHQLFDIDLKIKWTVKKGTLVAIFVGVFFVSAQVAQAFLVTEWGWAVGGVVAGLLLLAINPLQRFAGRVADAAMPRVADTAEYRGRRKEEVYRATLEEMLVDGSVSVKERRVLMRLQEELGLDSGLALRLEKEVMDRGVAA